MYHFKKLTFTFLFLLFSIGFHAVAQTGTSGLKIGTTRDFLNLFSKQAGAYKTDAKQSVQLPVSSTKYLTVEFTAVTSNKNTTSYTGKVANEPNSSFALTNSARGLQGLILLNDQKIGYKYTAETPGAVFVKEESINQLICVDHPMLPALNKASAITPVNFPTTLQSLPGAEAVMYLDFDGEYVVSSFWNNGNPIDAKPSTMTDAEIHESWVLISEDFRPFMINVTTNLDVFNAAPANRRMHCIFTPTTTAAPGSGGVAYIGSFSWGNNVPCWVFNTGAKYAGEAGSHELGHTVGLSHDGRISPPEEYFYGHNGTWAPIMGAAYYVTTGQWSKGEYASANNTQDQLNIIATSNGFGYRPDDYGNTIATATPLIPDAGNMVIKNGVITTRTDIDFFSLTLGTAKNINITINPSPMHPDLNIRAELRNASNVLIAYSDPPGMAAPSFNMPLPAGTYYITVDGVGELDPLLTGYSDYASLGEYTLKGTVELQSNVTVYFKTKSGMCTPRVHYWNKVPAGHGTTWPGDLMTIAPEKGPSWYKYIIMNATSTSLLFHDACNYKTPDFANVSGGCFDASVNNWINCSTNRPPVVTVSPKGGNYQTPQTVCITVKDVIDSNVVFYYTTNGIEPTTTSTSYYNYTCLTIATPTKLWILAVNNHGDKTYQVADYTFNTTPSLTVYFKAKPGMCAPRVHYWNKVPGGGGTAWPGNLMTTAPEKGSAWYKYTVADATSVNLLFHDDCGYKTSDLMQVTGGCFDASTNTWVNCNAGITLYFKTKPGMCAPKIHYWNAMPGTTSSTWPGNLMSAAPENGMNWFKYTIAGATSTSLLFHDGCNYKTADLNNITGGCYDAAANNWVSCPAGDVASSNNPHLNIMTGIATTDVSNDIMIYPNPFRDILTIEYANEGAQSVSVSIADIMGKEVLQEKINASGKFSKEFILQGLDPGFYFITLQLNNGQPLIKKMVKN